jgi:hypothetical protein
LRHSQQLLTSAPSRGEHAFGSAGADESGVAGDANPLQWDEDIAELAGQST